MSMLQKIHDCIRQRDLCREHHHVLLAVSGGADSVAMAHALHGLLDTFPLQLAIAHLDHGLRGEEAKEDARFVKAFAEHLELPFYGGESDVGEEAKRQGISIEMAARELRYDFLCTTARRIGASHICTAHTADDQVETLLLRIARGTGPQGLAGIPYKSDREGVTLIRPMRDVARDDVIAYLDEVSQAWREDHTNRDHKFLRNRVRHKVIPMLKEELNLQLDDAVLRLGELAADERTWIDEAVVAPYTDCLGGVNDEGHTVLLADRLAAQPSAVQRIILLRWLSECGVHTSRIDFPCVRRLQALATSSQGTRRADLYGGKFVRRAYERLELITSYDEVIEPFCLDLVIPGETVLKPQGWRIRTAWREGVLRPSEERVGVLPACASIDREALGSSRVQVRSWNEGDKIQPLGMDGSRKLQDIFVDGKVPQSERCRIPVVVCGEEIIWLPGYRVARDWAVQRERDVSLHVQIEQL